MNIGAILLVIFITLKLVGIIAWSWLWVLSPLWIGFLIWLIFAAIIYAGASSKPATVSRF